jgi:uncharacterized membrane protein
MTFTVLFICLTISVTYAQDSTKRAVPSKVVVVNPNIKYKTNKYHQHTKADSAAKAKPQQTTQIKPDTQVAAPVIYDKSLKGQYKYVLSKVYHYQQPLVYSLWRSVSDTLNADRRKLKDVQNKLNLKNKAIDSLKTTAADKEQSLAALNDRIVFFGIPFSKTFYSVMVWGLVVLFGITAVVVVARSANFRRVAKERTLLYTELEEEFKAFKIKANDKEKKLARELQTERNKLDDLLGR